ncbi:MAG: nitroreductase family protein [Bacteroides sp.]|nr:nitroreductase family protein [Bacteroidales bacterium]MBD5368767.1 nitroreductase family protein [Bacteroides sp.]
MKENNPAYQNIVTRTSVRRFSDAPVSDDDTEALLRAAMSAPSGVNRQPWELIVVDDAELRRRLADALPYAKMAAGAPLVIVVCGNEERFLDGDDSTLWVQDVSAVSENILLAAHSLGLGGVWTCLYPHADRIKKAAEILSIPAGIIPFSLIPVGYPEAVQKPIDKWRPERVHRNHY